MVYKIRNHIFLCLYHFSVLKYQYNSLSKSVDLLEYIHEQCTRRILITAKKNNGILKKIVSPIAYEVLDIHNEDIFKKLKLKGKYYIAPAGMRAEHWYYVNASKLNSMEFLGFLDNNKQEENIYPMNILQDDPNVYVIIACKFYFKEILHQLQQLKKEDKLINAGFVCYIDQEEVIYYFDLKQYKKLLENTGNEKGEESGKI